VHAAVVGGEDDEGVLRQPMVVERLEHASAGGVERFDERGVGRMEGLRVGLDALGRRGERDVRVVEGEVEEEGLGLAALDELHRVVGLAEFAFAALRRGGAGIGASGEVLVKAMVGRLVAFAAEVPLAYGRGGVALGLEQLRNRLHAGREVGVDRRAQQPVRAAVGAAGEEGRDLEAGRTLAGQQAGARRRADRSRGVGLREARAFGGEFVQVRRALVLAAEAAEVVDAQVIGEEDHEVGRRLLRAGGDEREQGAEDEAEDEAGHSLGLTSAQIVQRAKPA